MYFPGLDDGNQGKLAIPGGYEQAVAEMARKESVEGIRKQQQKASRNQQEEKKEGYKGLIK